MYKIELKTNKQQQKECGKMSVEMLKILVLILMSLKICLSRRIKMSSSCSVSLLEKTLLNKTMIVYGFTQVYCIRKEFKLTTR